MYLTKMEKINVENSFITVATKSFMLIDQNIKVKRIQAKKK